MNITLIERYNADPEIIDFVQGGYELGTHQGAFPENRHPPSYGEMIVVARDGDDLLGFATFFHHQVSESEECVWLDLLWVPPPHRRKSVGTRLVAAVLAYGERHGMAVEFGTKADNLEMQALTESFGLQPYLIGYRREPVAA